MNTQNINRFAGPSQQNRSVRHETVNQQNRSANDVRRSPNGSGNINRSQNSINANRNINQNLANSVPDTASTATLVKKRTQIPVKTTDVIRVRGGIDRPMMIIIILLLCFGSLMVFSASFAYAYDKTGDSYYYIKRQIGYGLLGLGAMFFASFFDYRIFKKVTIPYFLGICILLVLVLIKGAASGVAVRWFTIAGQSFQPSEFMKLGIVMMIAWYMDKYQDRVRSKNFWYSSFWGDFLPFIIVAFVCLLVALEKHFSGTIILFCIGLLVIFAGGARKLWFGVFGGVSATVIFLAIQLVPYAKKRLDIFLHPENYDALNEVWQTRQGVIAVGSGGLFGVGFGNSSQKYMFVSQPQNDFIFSIICEELGFLGALAVIALFAAFVWRGVVIALRAPDTFSSLVVIGIVGKVAIQSILNMMVVTDIIPNTGITLPFFSYGGTALVVLLAEMGIVLAISRYTYDEK